MIPIPFTLTHTDHAQGIYRHTVLAGLVGLDEDDVVLQYREKTTRYTWGKAEQRDSDVTEARIPLPAVRRAELRRGWFRTRLILYAADLRGFVGISGFSGSQLTLHIPRSERTGAE